MGGGPLPANGVFKIRGVRDFKNRPVAVQVRLGDATGTIDHQVEVQALFVDELLVLDRRHLRGTDDLGFEPVGQNVL